MSYAIEGNAIATASFDRVSEERALEALRLLTDADAFRHARSSDVTDYQPVFIVGMNRSGTTLVEAILSRHPAIFAAGERNDIHQIEREGRRLINRPLDRHSLALHLNRDWLSDEADRLRRASVLRAGRSAKRFTDKLPENALRLGLIARLFPKARIIHVRRHPLDTGLSNFFRRFQYGEGFSYRMDWIGARTRHIAESMALWRRAIDLPILDVNYEKLVTDPERQSRRIIDFVELPWSELCLEPARTERPILTASQWQIRQPIYRGSVGKWKAYEAWLTPMIDAMGGFQWIDAEVADMSR